MGILRRGFVRGDGDLDAAAVRLCCGGDARGGAAAEADQRAVGASGGGLEGVAVAGEAPSWDRWRRALEIQQLRRGAVLG